VKIEKGMKIAIWGAGGHGGVVFDAARQQGLYECTAFIDDTKTSGEPFHRSGLPVLYGRHQFARLRAEGVTGVVIAVGDDAARRSLAAIAIESGLTLCTVLHPSAVICDHVRIGEGTVVFAGAIVQTGVTIGGNVIINTGVVVDHDCVIGDGAQLAPRVTVGGDVKVGEMSFVGIGATISNRVEIGRNCLIGAGGVVVRNIPDDAVAYGVPARVIRWRTT
jgi:sugar O-acyltransferase (sialic acid O-acetyltransferase NeuD family)